jgi:hypothetical protein
VVVGESESAEGARERVIVGLSEKGVTRGVWWLCVQVLCCWSSYLVLFSESVCDCWFE